MNTMDEDIISIRTGKIIDYAYYRKLIYSYKDNTISDDERFDLELALARFEHNSFFR